MRVVLHEVVNTDLCIGTWCLQTHTAVELIALINVGVNKVIVGG